MVAHPDTAPPPAADPTLASLWRTTALRVTRSGILGVLGAGIAAIAFNRIRLSASVTGAVAGIAALIAGLLILAAIFGGSIEVMRR